MDKSEGDGMTIGVRVDAFGGPLWLPAGSYEVTAVIPEHLRRPQVAAYWCDEPVQITYRD